MRSALFIAIAMLAGPGWTSLAPADDSRPFHDAVEGIEALMVDVSHRPLPSKAEWAALHEDGQRGGGSMLGGLCDFKSNSIAFMNTRYYTANPAEGTLSSYGKLDDKRYDRFGHIHGIEFSIDQNSWKQRHVCNAAALAQLAGSRFLEFAGVGLDASIKNQQQIEVTFVGTTVPKDEAIRRLNMDYEALEYLEAVQRERDHYDSQPVKLFAGKAPPSPRIVLANVIMLDGNFSKALDASIDGKLYSRILDDGVQLKVTTQNGQEVTLLSPLVRCYRTYSLEFKKDANGRLQRIGLRDAHGRTHVVSQVFDLTPDL